ncbi:polysaccharide deacetylase family protein [Spirosoma radiotolerans]|uniref:ChbG/HpnK family deacetylase n=1 Tax=Spirosoma radiotolerans TaxID=1379870 RepID=A0A0E3V5S3_9BACT|nr:polysaccharide deacetylase family protein [Spirosoma radiotolerans]AKD54407.1 hypothetical protein SD10_05265 [Spirosoma radiotolerans]
MTHVLILLVLLCGTIGHINAQTYAEKLGWPKGSKVVIFHVDDAGMSYPSNQGAIKSLEQGTATSTSIMMPCPWSASFVNYALKTGIDAGIHLTLTSEWKNYRWSPLAGSKQVPGLTDPEGAFWPDVPDVIRHATADEVELEMKAQIDRAIAMGLKPTHLDSHMGTLFANESYLERYIRVGIAYGIPVMFPGGNNKLLIECTNYPLVEQLKAEGKWKEGTQLPLPENLKKAKAVGDMIWKSGLPVLDDLHTISGNWKPATTGVTPEAWGTYKTAQFKDALTRMEPGLAMFIIHSTDASGEFHQISSSGGSRYADMLSMTDPDLKTYLRKEGIILTTWREVMTRRKQAK